MMDFSLKQWRDESEEEEQESSAVGPCAKLQRLNNPHYSSPALPLFVPHPTSPTKLSPPRMGSYFSLGQWQELELQALIFRHMMAGAAVPPELLHLVNNSSPPYQQLHYYHPSLVHTGYWGKAAMDPEPGRCRRTDGKKWRCSRDVVAAHKYCERHMHRGKNRSRKPVEIPTSAHPKPNISPSAAPPFTLSTSHYQRPVESMGEPKYPFQAQNGAGGDPTLRHFFDDWPREADDAAHSATNLSISTSDFSLKLGTSNEDECRGQGSRPQMNWGMAWEAAHRAAPMGGPLAEALALRSSLSTSSPTSVLHRLQRS